MVIGKFSEGERNALVKLITVLLIMSRLNLDTFPSETTSFGGDRP